MTAAEDEFYKRMGERIAVLRRRRGISQGKLADMIGIARPTMSNLESGKCGTTSYRLMLLCRALGCETDDLLPTRPRPVDEIPVTMVLTVGGRTAKFVHTF